MSGFRIGQAVDVHALAEGRPLVLGGLEIPHDKGLAGHSDGDALLHAVASALLGALGDGDLGTHFPSSDPSLEGIASRVLVERVMQRVSDAGFAIANVDSTVVAQEPRLGPHLEKLRASLADVLGAGRHRVNVKVTSTDHLGFLGRGEGIAAMAVVLLEARS
ncbi:MAG: 2-C-methyl-D-erythritol 2,4-cyclodiphosphate synthase [Myxococcota bacterium]